MTEHEAMGEAPEPQGAPGTEGADDANRRRGRRGRRGRGGAGFSGAPSQAAPFRPQGQGFRGPRPPGFRPAPQPGFRPGGPRYDQAFRAPRPQVAAPADDDDSSQARELAAYERRQKQGAGGFRPQGAWRRDQRRGGPGYADTIRRVTGGPQGAAPSHDAGEPIAGPHAVLEAIRSGRVLRSLYISQDRGVRTGAVNDVIAEAQQRRIFVRYVDRLELARLSPVENHQGVVAIVEGRPGVDLDELLLHIDTVEKPLVLVLDSLQDPQNLGVVLRSAEGAGVAGVVIPRHRAVGITAAVARTSAGASEHLLVADVANLRQAIDALKEKGIWVVATDMSGDLLYDEVDYRGPTAIVVGGEHEGIRRLVLEGCDQVVRVPMLGKVESLNAAAAGTVLLFEAVRQRMRDAAPSPTRTPRPAPPPAPPPTRDEQSEPYGGDRWLEDDDDDESSADAPSEAFEATDEPASLAGANESAPPPAPAAKKTVRKAPAKKAAAAKAVTKKPAAKKAAARAPRSKPAE